AHHHAPHSFPTRRSSDLNSDSGSGGHDSHTSGASSSSPSSSTAAHNAQDVSFAQGMIPHHQQALEMAKLAAGRASSAKVKDLARSEEHTSELQSPYDLVC